MPIGEVSIDEWSLLGSGGGAWDRRYGFAVDAMAPQSRDLYNLDMLLDVNEYAGSQFAADRYAALLYNQEQFARPSMTTAPSTSTAGTAGPPIADVAATSVGQPSGSGTLFMAGLLVVGLIVLSRGM